MILPAPTVYTSNVPVVFCSINSSLRNHTLLFMETLFSLFTQIKHALSRSYNATNTCTLVSETTHFTSLWLISFSNLSLFSSSAARLKPRQWRSLWRRRRQLITQRRHHESCSPHMHWPPLAPPTACSPFLLFGVHTSAHIHYTYIHTYISNTVLLKLQALVYVSFSLRRI